MTTQIQTRRYTFEEYLELPEAEGRFDVVDGEIILASSPLPEHQVVSRQFFRILDSFITEGDFGELLFAPMDIVIRREPLRVRQPDLMFFRKGRFDRTARITEYAPDLAIEIISPSNSRSHVESKMQDYADIGLAECWWVSLSAHTIEVFTLTDGEWEFSGIYREEDMVQSGVLQGLEVEVSRLFA